MIICLNGKFVDKKRAQISAFDAGFLYGIGIFETLRSYDCEVWQLNAHIDRLFKSAKLAGIKMKWKRDEIANFALGVVKKNLKRGVKNHEQRIRITISGGLRERGETIFIFSEPLKKIPPKILKNGASAITFSLERALSEIKTTSLLPSVNARTQMQKKKAFEVLFLDRNNQVTEGSTSNVFIVARGVLFTPKKGILFGTTRAAVMKLAKKIMKVRESAVSKKELMNADEIFITSVIKGVVPVVKIDHKKIGNGKVGIFTKELQEIWSKNFSKKCV